jgi:hypothetical protein
LQCKVLGQTLTACDESCTPVLYIAKLEDVQVTDLSKALAQIDAIRGQVARGTRFRGYGPATLAATGLVAGFAAFIQSILLARPAQHIATYIAVWSATAALVVAVIGAETITRTRRVHEGLAPQMIRSAVEPFVPAIVVGLLLTVVLFRSAPQTLWMLPGLWQLVFSLGVFSSCKFLPRPIFAVGVWYLTTGLMCLASGPEHALSPVTMGVPFGIGQLLVAGILHFGDRDGDEKE